MMVRYFTTGSGCVTIIRVEFTIRELFRRSLDHVPRVPYGNGRV